MRDNQRGLYSMFSRGYNFLKRKGLCAVGLGGLALAFGSGQDALAEESKAADIDIDAIVSEVCKEEPKDENAKKTDIKSENQRKFAEAYEKLRAEMGKSSENGYFIEGRLRFASNRETEYDSWRASIELGKFIWGSDRWNGRLKFEYDDTDGREERFEASGWGDYKFSDQLTGGIKLFGGNHTAGLEGRIRITIDPADVISELKNVMIYARGGGSVTNDRITDVETTGLLDSDQHIEDGFGELGLKIATKDGWYLSIADIFKWINSDISPNIPTSVDADIETETNAVIASIGKRAREYSLDLTGIWTSIRTRDILADSVEKDNMYRLQGTAFYHFKEKGHSLGVMIGGDKNGWDVRGIYIFQDGKSDIARELDKLKTEKEAISQQEIMDRLEALSSISLLVHKVELGGRRSELPNLQGWEAFANYQLTVSMNSGLLEQLRLSFEGTYGELNPRYSDNQRYFRGTFGAEARFGKGIYAFGDVTGTAQEGRLPTWTGSVGAGKRF